MDTFLTFERGYAFIIEGFAIPIILYRISIIPSILLYDHCPSSNWNIEVDFPILNKKIRKRFTFFAQKCLLIALLLAIESAIFSKKIPYTFHIIATIHWDVYFAA